MSVSRTGMEAAAGVVDQVVEGAAGLGLDGVHGGGDGGG